MATSQGDPSHGPTPASCRPILRQRDRAPEGAQPEPLPPEPLTGFLRSPKPVTASAPRHTFPTLYSLGQGLLAHRRGRSSSSAVRLCPAARLRQVKVGRAAKRRRCRRRCLQRASTPHTAGACEDALVTVCQNPPYRPGLGRTPGRLQDRWAARGQREDRQHKGTVKPCPRMRVSPALCEASPVRDRGNDHSSRYAIADNMFKGLFLEAHSPNKRAVQRSS